MTCERYWREGIVLAERGLDDPHRDGCDDCARAHASRQELIEALPLIGEDLTEDPYWQAKVWDRIDGTRARAPWRWRWQLAGALAAAAVIALWIGVGRSRPGEVRPLVSITEAGPQRRSASTRGGDRLDAHVNDRLHAAAGETSEIWIYREARLVLQCRPQQVQRGCAPDAQGMTVDLVLSLPGAYDVIITADPSRLPPRGELDEDVAALESAGVSYLERKAVVH